MAGYRRVWPNIQYLRISRHWINLVSAAFGKVWRLNIRLLPNIAIAFTGAHLLYSIWRNWWRQLETSVLGLRTAVEEKKSAADSLEVKDVQTFKRNSPTRWIFLLKVYNLKTFCICADGFKYISMVSWYHVFITPF